MIAHDLIDFSRPRRLHLLGIGGSGMAPFSRLLRRAGHRVSGADRRAGPEVVRLRAEGVHVATGADSEGVPADVDALIHSAAVPPAHPARVEARRRKLPVLKYARAVGLFTAGRATWAVAGTHGKTTTSALLAFAAQEAGLDPRPLVGGRVLQLRTGRSGPFVVEACEYDRSFLHLRPELAIVTNVEAEHLDYFRDIVEITAAFRTFAAQVGEGLVLHESLHETLGRAGGVRARVITFGFGHRADVRIEALGPHRFRALGRTWKLALPGRHNLLNAAAVLCAARARGLDLDAVASALERFRGVGRRLELVGRPRGVPVVDDYAHHPTEVEAGLRALREEYAPRRLWVVFQPHQYSRLRRFLPEFARVLAAADRVVVPAVYRARDAEEDLRAVSAEDLVEAVRASGGDAVAIPDFAAIVDFVRTQARAGDVVVTMGAGDVGHVAGRLAQSL